MAIKCDICGKKSVRANHVSHSKVKVPRRQKPNLQKIKIDGKAMKICSTCRRTIAKNTK